MQLDVILRTCDQVFSVHESGSGNQYRVPGPAFTKLDIMLRCINSLLISMNLSKEDLRLVVVDDHSNEIERIRNLLERCNHPVKFIPMIETGNGVSLKVCYDWAQEEGRDYLFFVEDDYLHSSLCVQEMISELPMFRKKLNYEVALFPCDNIDNYMQTAKNNVPCFITLGSNRHWRTTCNSTSTFLCSKYLFEKYYFLFEKMTHYGRDPSVGEATTYNQIWTAPYNQMGGAFLLSPIPTLSLHFHFQEHLSPFTNWQDWWSRAKL